MSYCMPPECDGIPNPSRHAIEPDWVASECDDQLPAFSKIGRGPRGKGVYTEIEKTGDGQVIIHFKDDETGEEIGNTGDIAAGRINVSYAPENPVAGDEVKMFVSVRNGSSVANYVVPVPSGAHGSRIYLFPGPVSRNSDDTYQCSVDDLTIYGLQRWESKPEPRPNDVILFNYEDSDGHGFAFGTIEAVESGQVVYTARVFNTLPGVSILPDGTWAVDGESTGIKAQGPKGEDAKIKVRREGGKAVITATDSDGETTAEVLDGKDGRDAKLSVQRVENGATLTAIDSTGITTATVKDGSDGEDGSDGLPAMLTLGTVQETSQPQVSLIPGRVQMNEYIISFGLPRGADGKSVDIQGGIYQVDQLPDFDETPVNRAFIVNDGDNVYDLYIRGRVPVIAEEGGPWTVVEDWQGMQGYSLRLLNGYKISQDAPISIPKEEVDTAFTPSINVQDGDLVLDADSMIGVVGSAQDDSGAYTVSYVAKLQVNWDNVAEKPDDLAQLFVIETNDDTDGSYGFKQYGVRPSGNVRQDVNEWSPESDVIHVRPALRGTSDSPLGPCYEQDIEFGREHFWYRTGDNGRVITLSDDVINALKPNFETFMEEDGSVIAKLTLYKSDGEKASTPGFAICADDNADPMEQTGTFSAFAGGVIQISTAEDKSVGSEWIGSDLRPGSIELFYRTFKGDEDNSYNGGPTVTISVRKDRSFISADHGMFFRIGNSAHPVVDAYIDTLHYKTLDPPISVDVPVATTEAAGIVKPDGTSVTVDPDGTIHSSNYVLPEATSTILGGVKVSNYDTASGFMGF